MKKIIWVSSFFVLYIIAGCEQRVSIQTSIDIFEDKIHIHSYNSNEKFPTVVKNYFNANKEKKYFNLPYYLVPEEKVSAVRFENFPTQITSTLTFSMSGKIHYKYFVTPEIAKKMPNDLRGNFQFIGPSSSEFLAVAVNENPLKLLVWSKNFETRKPFIVSLEAEYDANNEIIKANQKAIFKIFKDINPRDYKIAFEDFSLKYNIPGKEQVNLEQFFEIKNENILYDEINLFDISKTAEIVKKSNLIFGDFIKKTLLSDFSKTVEDFTIKNGMILDPNFHSIKLKPTFNDQTPLVFQISEVENLRPDILILEKNNQSSEYYTGANNVPKFKLNESKDNFKKFIANFKENILDKYLVYGVNNSLLSTKEKSLLESEMKKTLLNIESKYLIRRIQLNNLANYKKIGNKEKAISYTEIKRSNQEWISYNETRLPASEVEFYMSNNCVVEVANGVIIGFGLYNEDEKELYKVKKSLPFFEN